MVWCGGDRLWCGVEGTGYGVVWRGQVMCGVEGTGYGVVWRGQVMCDEVRVWRG